MYASLMISLLAAFVAMLGKQWLNRYLRNSGGSMIERCGDRQRKFNEFEKWPLHFFVESLPVMLQAALLLLACGLCRHMWTINASVAYTLISLTGVGVGFYVAIVIAGMSSSPCPFQTLAYVALRFLWKKAQDGIVSLTVHHTRVLSWICRMWNQGVRSLLRLQPLPTTTPLDNVEVQRSEPWMTPKDLAIICRTNADDVLCASWILSNITDPEALDAAVRLAGTIRWFDDGINVDPSYDLIVSTFKGCFDLTGKLHPGSRDRAYHSGRAVMWIHTLAMCKSEAFGNTFPLPDTKCIALGLDHDLEHLLQANRPTSSELRIRPLLAIGPEHTPSHSQWISNVLLHHAWVNRTKLDRDFLLQFIPGVRETKITLPLDAALGRLLVWCILLDSPVEEEVLKIQDKSYDISFFPSHC